jgi:hypothetical protein
MVSCVLVQGMALKVKLAVRPPLQMARATEMLAGMTWLPIGRQACDGRRFGLGHGNSSAASQCSPKARLDMISIYTKDTIRNAKARS